MTTQEGKGAELRDRRSLGITLPDSVEPGRAGMAAAQDDNHTG